MRYTNVGNKSNNAAVDSTGGILQRKCACGRSKGPTGKCAECRRKHAGVQTKLRVNKPGDRYEQEADRVAKQVLSMSEPAHITPVQTMSVQRSVAGETVTAEHASPDIKQSGGQPLPAKTRQYFEPRFGHDFSQVRIHTDSQAVQASRELNARAFTLGKNISFEPSEFAPETPQGRQLIAHELTHVIQQQSANSAPDLLQRELVFGSGYKRPYTSDNTEINHAEQGDWSPSSVDFKAGAASSGGGTGISKLSGLLNHIKGKAAGSISELGLIGHANSTYFGLSGNITGKQVIFTGPGMISADALKAKAATIQKEKLHDRFAKGGKIILYGCNAGSGKGLLDAISQAFQVCVHGFKDEISFCFQWKPPTGNKRKIINRGRVDYSPLVINTDDPLAGLEGPKSCDAYKTSISSLSTDNQSCKGVPKAPTQEELSLFGPLPMLDAGEWSFESDPTV